MTTRASQSGQPARDDHNAERALEQAVNEIAADQAAMRIVLQSFLLRLFAARADGASAAFADFREHVSRSIAAIPPAADDPLGAARWKRLVATSAERLLGEVDEAVGASLGDRARRKARG